MIRYRCGIHEYGNNGEKFNHFTLQIKTWYGFWRTYGRNISYGYGSYFQPIKFKSTEEIEKYLVLKYGDTMGGTITLKQYPGFQVKTVEMPLIGSL